jgi:hypothetical protein
MRGAGLLLEGSKILLITPDNPSTYLMLPRGYYAFPDFTSHKSYPSSTKYAVAMHFE